MTSLAVATALALLGLVSGLVTAGPASAFTLIADEPNSAGTQEGNRAPSTQERGSGSPAAAPRPKPDDDAAADDQGPGCSYPQQDLELLV
ncbi:MAG: hypothetical protein AAFR04_04945 [Pseudomonadota bacterium]